MLTCLNATIASVYAHPQDVLADQTGQLLPPPPQWLPSLYRNEYLLDGAVDLKSMPMSDVYNGNPTALDWSKVQTF